MLNENIKSRVLKFTMLWTIVNHCVENYIKNFKACWKPCQKFQSMLKHSFQNALQISTRAEIQFSTCVTDFNMHVSKITMTWPLHDPFHQFWNIIAVIKIKSDIINEDYRSLWCYMWSVIEILCGLEEKIGPDCMQLLHNMHATENFKFNLVVNFLYFLSNWVNLLRIFTSCEKLRAFKSMLLEQIFDALEMNNSTFMRVLKSFSEIFP